MRFFGMIIAGLLLVAGPVLAEEKKELKTQKEKISYSIGFGMGSSLKRDGLDIDTAVLSNAMKDAYAGEKPMMTEQEMRDVIVALQQELQKKQREQQALQQEKMKAAGEKNKKEGVAFLAQNKAKEGVKVLPSGLQYKVLANGSGKSPKATDSVTVHYRGTLIDGTEFDSSYKRGQPATFSVGGVIKGWTEALQLMKEGDKWQLFIPSNLAYGEGGTPGGIIGPNAVLLFEVELIAVGAK